MVRRLHLDSDLGQAALDDDPRVGPVLVALVGYDVELKGLAVLVQNVRRRCLSLQPAWAKSSLAFLGS